MTSIPEHSTEKPITAAYPKEATFLRELKEKFGSEEEARRVFALFSSMQQERSTGVTAAVPPPPTIPDETTAQPSIAHPDEPQASIRAPAHDQSHTEEEEASGQKDGGDLGTELDRIVVDDMGKRMLMKGKPLWMRVWRGKPLC